MDSIDFFNDNGAELPKTRSTSKQDQDFSSFLELTFANYLNLLSSLSPDEYLAKEILAKKSIVECLCKHLLAAVRHSEKGLPHMAFQEVSDGIELVKVHLNPLATLEVGQTKQFSELYRIRIKSPGGSRFQKKDLFHIPFESRHLVRTQRYSVPGLPCLYMSGSLYAAWEEMGRPKFDGIYFARFKPSAKATIKVLNFGYRPAQFAAYINAMPQRFTNGSSLANLAVSYAVCWPLIAACSIKKTHKDAQFVAEYSVPQLLLQWVISSTEYDGIRYFSTHIDHYPDSPTLGCNFVFPAKAIAANGYCENLRTKFEMTEPIYWPFAAQLDGVNEPADLPDDRRNGRNTSLIKLLPWQETAYLNTLFGQIEAKCNVSPLAMLESGH
jgi:hypothetical protein